jgi:Spy/CpxP family protein refolding chaperone
MITFLAVATLVSGLNSSGLNSAQECPNHPKHATEAAQPASIAAPQSPYVEQETRAIKALSEADVSAYLDGAGMGMARPAELNRYPGPRHVLEHAEALKLTGPQRASVEAAFRRMKAEAVALGEQVVEGERRLDRLFAEAGADVNAVSQLTRQLGELQGRLRSAHLRAHVEVRELLTAEQVALYVGLRGYEHTGH